jgi:uncharacterized protein (TIGR02646 family)
MIPVVPQPEPADFEQLVRKPGLKWLKKSGLDPSLPAPTKTKIPPHWRKCLPHLHKAYGGICTYVCVYVPKMVGASSVEHFVPKSRNLNQAYEWSNYRFVCAKMNSRKRDFEDVLDPFTIEPDLFVLRLGSGKLDPHPSLTGDKLKVVKETIKRLDLDDQECRDKRLEIINDVLLNQSDKDDGMTVGQLKRHAPFVWQEMKRQGWL